MANDFPPFAFTTQESWYGELSFKAAEDGSPVPLAGRQFEMHVTPASSGSQLIAPVIILTMEAGRGLSLKQGDSSTLVFRVPKSTANTFPRQEYTADVLEVVNGERYLFMPVRITYAEPSGLRSFLTRFLGVSVSFAARQQPIYTPLAVPGREGRPGATILRGAAPPVSADGKDDDYYIEDRTASGQGRRMWGPKAGGAWPGTPWNIQVASYSDVPGLTKAIDDGALAVLSTTALGAGTLVPAPGPLPEWLALIDAVRRRFVDVTDKLFGAVADGVTDCTAAFVAAAAAAAPGSGVFVPPSAQPYVVNTVQLSRNVEFFSWGPGATIKHKAGAQATMFECASGGKTYKFRGITFDGNRAAQAPDFAGRIIRMNKLGGVGNNATVLDIESCAFNNVAQFGVLFYGDLNDATREQVYIRRCRFNGINEGGGNGSAYNPSFVALYDGIETAVLEGNDFDIGYTPTGAGANAVHVSTTSNTTKRTVRLALERNVIRGLGRLATNGLGAVDVYIWGENISFIGNRVYSPYAPGLRCKLSSENAIIAHNQIYNVQNGHNGISLSNGTTEANYGKIIVTDNIVDGAFNGIVVQGSNSSQAKNVICSNNIVRNTSDAAIYLENVFDAQASGNQVGAAGSYGILVSKWGGSLSINDNIVNGTASWGVYATRLSVSNGPLLSLCRNQIQAAANIGINVVGAGRVTANDNQFDSISGTNTLIKLDAVTVAAIVQGNNGLGTTNLQITNSPGIITKEANNSWNVQAVGTLVLAASAVATSLTGSTTETTLATVPIAAGAIGPNGQLRITMLWSYSNSANNKTQRVKLGTSQFMLKSATTTTTDRTQVQIANRGAENSQVAGPSAATTGGWSTTTAAVATGSIDTSLGQVLTITGQLASATDTMTLESYTVELLKAA